MAIDIFQLQEELTPKLRAGELDEVERIVAEQLKKQPDSPFHVVLDLSITNSRYVVAAHFDEFFRKEASRFKIAAAYTETNGFYINPDRWFFDVFAYEQYGGHEDYGWLADWQSDQYEDMTIKGLEDLQSVYASDAAGNRELRDANDLATLLVVIKFQDLIRRAAPLMKELHFPLLATAHDFDFLFETGPRTRGQSPTANGEAHS